MTELKLEFQLENPELPVDLDKVILSFDRELFTGSI